MSVQLSFTHKLLALSVAGVFALTGCNQNTPAEGTPIGANGKPAETAPATTAPSTGEFAELKAQFDQLPLYQCVALHALAGDRLAQAGSRSLQAPQMVNALCQVLNDG